MKDNLKTGGLFAAILLVFSLVVFDSQRQQYDIRLPMVITPSVEVEHLVSTLNNMNYGDSLTLRINSYGGDIHSGMEILNAVSHTKGHVKVVLDGGAYSMAAVIASVATDIETRPYSLVLFHVCRDETGIIYDDPIALYFNSQVYNIVKHVLNQKELNSVFVDGKDLVITGEELTDRKHNGVPNETSNPANENLVAPGTPTLTPPKITSTLPFVN